MSVLDTFSLAGRVSVVTGAARGIGRALARALAEAGSDVVLLVRDPAGAAPVVAELTGLGVRAVAVGADVTRAAEVAAAVPAVLEALGRVDVLVNNAGACVHRPALEVTAAEWQQVLDEPGRRPALPPALDRGRPDAAVRAAGGARPGGRLPGVRGIVLRHRRGAGRRRRLRAVLTATAPAEAGRCQVSVARAA